MDAQPLYDLSPLAQLMLLGAVLAIGPLAWIAWRHRHASAASRWHALTLLTLFLTFDLVLFGAFTRLTDSGLGCPDWPGCYGNASPLGAHHEISAAQEAMPTGPVTHRKAWIEMVHRYLATTVGALITVLAWGRWREWRRARGARAARGPGARDAPLISPWWATATLAWVCVQGAFGALTVTMKLYPAIVTLHLLGGLALLALLAAQTRPAGGMPTGLSRGLRRGVAAVFALSVLQIALGGWVSTNYAVLACTDFPRCQGSWWPDMEFGHAYALLRDLGHTTEGDYLSFEALTAIHYVHRLGAYAVFIALGVLAASLWRAGGAARPWARALAGIGLWQLATGLGNVLLGWPLLAAVAHTGGAAALVVLLTHILTRSATAGAAERASALGRPAAA